MGPACEVVFEPTPAVDHLQVIDALLASVSDRIERTRKGRVWDLWIRGHRFHVGVKLEDGFEYMDLWAGYNSPVDYEVLRELSQQLAQALDGLASEPTK